MALDPTTYDRLYINGEYIRSKSDKTLSLRSPKNGSLISDVVPLAGSGDVDAAVHHAEAAFAGPWSRVSAAERSVCLLRLAGLLKTRLPDILALDRLTTNKTGTIRSSLLQLAGWLKNQPISRMWASLLFTDDKEKVWSCLQHYAGLTDKQKDSFSLADDGHVKLVRHDPLGVCVALNDHSSPIVSFMEMAVPCLVTGNVLIVKPPEKSPLGSLAIAPLFEQAGFPRGVVQVLTGDDFTRDLLSSHTRNVLAKYRIFRYFYSSSSPSVSPSGTCPAIICRDADMENALAWTVDSIFAGQGQVVTRTALYIHRAIAADFLEAYTQRINAATDRLKIQPADFAESQPHIQIVTFESEDGVMQRVNDSDHGIIASVFTRDAARGIQFSSRIDARVVGINCIRTLARSPQLSLFMITGNR
ncbi:aldehyde dehydrogenase 1a3 [Grosmannia clavigera kw1407]|uniref:aldehyde dehydrogenase (NAD(+)) n=1 Tax=Grosmannia clavigera (strain kw1407 / UAMH 11150) TaxID=655863 RepID=F0XEL3_GROCL|nr:aldehyde dehydrogenase 1a3 [Grosmannia clavigera kw1407]EFX04425.1 aldehyde dehydrogenase 1a3 [Grosmannia clavigera kw1407]